MRPLQRARQVIAATVIATGAIVINGVFGVPMMRADPPPPRPVIGPLQYGPPGYGLVTGAPEMPSQMPGVSISADTLGPGSDPNAVRTGPVGVRIVADSLSPGRPQP
ncbi:hypothetical protein IUQ79_02710 [Mycobacteroides abscessus subsp. bolletii]|uniref:hypothetical protein n=1 Tax=Mycobacteroides abscessus TaxID=36809 RepID=UPI0019CF622E|nr:hypothetical protein [Mycobacteroides abscessus]MBN7300796.1 hypothetical protein [Mycobacteroides abscessus subsp. bolletii]